MGPQSRTTTYPSPNTPPGPLLGPPEGTTAALRAYPGPTLGERDGGRRVGKISMIKKVGLLIFGLVS